MKESDYPYTLNPKMALLDVLPVAPGSLFLEPSSQPGYMAELIPPPVEDRISDAIKSDDNVTPVPTPARFFHS